MIENLLVASNYKNRKIIGKYQLVLNIVTHYNIVSYI